MAILPSSLGAISRLPRLRHTALAVAGSVVVADQVSKALVRQFVPLHDSVSLVPGLLNLTHVRNTGAAFGILNSADFPFKAAVMTGVALVALVALGIYAVQAESHGSTARVGLALILGGALGNLIDRIAIGHVVDFVDVYWGTYHFWAFNVADSAITIGAGFLLTDTLLTRHHDVSNPA
ncbi:MAG: signal peptidase II [Vicinamibacterales bacterium]|jgi:signal peptidase II|nr:signal peptidase II [Acidobacteriota bacterium]MDP7294689.1 signal peptidase II [Vicinamibacterales bacterium]MDP7472331.1 signal peptidase II [Vicinamibacterales bacterium]MDP7672077.1 signal peptidase II [Vicinamibacterales bacterium]HJO39840.1 signal peptidase II [Vicinamibacterales bacterium]|tara:strand:- start:1579 stop:2115 length:537 start_codon:yes stop_codon:yes gene_type:complete